MRGILAVLLGILPLSAANAGVDLIQVPAACGTTAEITGFLRPKMPDPAMIGTGGDARGSKIATLLVGTNGYWALLADLGPGKVCIVASGRGWTSAEIVAGSI